MKKIVLAALSALLLLTHAAFAQEDPRVAKAQDWLNNLKTATAHFEQKGFDGRVASGEFFIHRPGRLRFQYDNSKDILVADGVLIHFYDSEQNQSSSSPIGLTLADFLLRKHINLQGDLSVTNLRTKNGITSIEVVQTADPDAGHLILNFTENPYQLLSWIVIDAQGTVTTVTLSNLETGMDLPYGLFVFKDPSGHDHMNN